MSDTLSFDQVQELLAGYVLGDLSPPEAEILAQLLQAHPELQGEIDRLQESLGLIPHDLPQHDPPADLEAKVLTAIEQAHPTPRSLPRPTAWIRLKRRPLLELVSGTLAAGLIAALGSENLRLRQQPDVVIQILSQPNTRLVSLQGDQEIAPQASGSLLFIPGQWQEVVITLKDLPPPPADQVYRLWARFGDGKVILCGEFEPDAAGAIVAQLQTRDLPNPGSGLVEVFATLAVPTTPLEPQGSAVLTQVSS